MSDGKKPADRVAELEAAIDKIKERDMEARPDPAGAPARDRPDPAGAETLRGISPAAGGPISSPGWRKSRNS